MFFYPIVRFILLDNYTLLQCTGLIVTWADFESVVCKLKCRLKYLLFMDMYLFFSLTFLIGSPLYICLYKALLTSCVYEYKAGLSYRTAFPR